ncbi:hypothetical protein BDV24DRAFT_170205 [Aspergillus arachidicola]|uniref:Uncharacterized protein n=1 Tax=Aspergillus arachidicola TaxID=656916 RepID=A0A5N6XQL0_9EURO|nr:hypothetical protein BDV24DRAFT_170205 [Aspergillus arachidicola]
MAWNAIRPTRACSCCRIRRGPISVSWGTPAPPRIPWDALTAAGLTSTGPRSVMCASEAMRRTGWEAESIPLPPESLAYVIHHSMTPVVRRTREPAADGLAVELPVCYIAADRSGNLEVMRTGTLAGLKRQLQGLLPSRVWSSGAPGGIKGSHTWEPSVRVPPTSSVGGALAGVSRWDDPGVVHELRTLFEGSVEEARALIQRDRQALLSRAAVYYNIFIEAEKAVYLSDSAYLERD